MWQKMGEGEDMQVAFLLLSFAFFWGGAGCDFEAKGWRDVIFERV